MTTEKQETVKVEKEWDGMEELTCDGDTIQIMRGEMLDEDDIVCNGEEGAFGGISFGI